MTASTIYAMNGRPFLVIASDPRTAGACAPFRGEAISFRFTRRIEIASPLRGSQ
jgi:hypothetical protein